MADPVSAAAIAGVVNEAFKFATTGLETYKARVVAKTQERTQEQAQAIAEIHRIEDRHLAREQYIRGRQDKITDDLRALEDAKALARDAAQLQNYPFRSGPGMLRRNIESLSRDRHEQPLVILFAAPHETSDPAWRALPRRLQWTLSAIDDLDPISFVTDRHLTWPDALLIYNELDGIPTIVVSAEVVTDKLHISLGGCSLGGDELIRRLRSIVWRPLPTAAEWTDAHLTMLERTSVNGFKVPPAGSPTFERELQLEWATRLAVVGIVAAIDTFYLLRRRGYREHVDDALAVLGPGLLPWSTQIPVDDLADPAYHLMHEAKRRMAIGDDDAARADVLSAIEALAGGRGPTPRESVLTARRAGRVESWHREMLEELAAHAEGHIVPADVLAALREPPPAVEDIARPAAPSGSPPETARSVAPQAHGRQVTETRQHSSAAPAAPTRGRTVTETRAGVHQEEEG